MNVADAPSRAASQPQREHVRDRVLRLGCNSLGLSDLLAVLLQGHGQEAPEVAATRLLDRFDGLLGLAGMEAQTLRRAGLTASAAARIAAAVELGRRLGQERRRHRPRLGTPEEVVAAIGPAMATLDHEQLWCLPLDAQSRLIGEPRVVSKGDVDGTDAGPRAFFRLALTAGASSCIAAHNHPGGDPAPSAADRACTARFVAAGRTVDVPLADHVVLSGGGRFTSLRRSCPECFR